MKPFYTPHPDPHSYFRSDQPQMTHLDWTARINFNRHTLHCEAKITFNRGGVVDLDTRNLRAISVRNADGDAIPHDQDSVQTPVGSRLYVAVPVQHPMVIIRYRTQPTASGLQWTQAQHTAGGTHPFLYSQAAFDHARSFIPCQDTPGVRFTFTAELQVPGHLKSLMAAQAQASFFRDGDRVDRWTMSHPIPAYLLAFAVGDLASRPLSDRVTAWTEPCLSDAAAYEFADVEKMITAAEELFGKDPWGRFDLLVPPPNFPYGGMENPTLVFVTPTLLAGDRSMVGTLAHELAHAWTGNLVTNATWGDLWINEGWTTYAEWRILEACYGSEAALIRMALLEREFHEDCMLFSDTPELTALCPNLRGRNLDDVYSRVPYFKGAMFLLALECVVGRERFDAFIQKYIETFAFKSLDTATFLDFVHANLPGAIERTQAWRWVYGPFLPETHAKITSTLLDEVIGCITQRRIPTRSEGEKWTVQQWIFFLRNFPRPATIDQLECLGYGYALSESRNRKLRWAFLLLASDSQDGRFWPEIETFVGSVGQTGLLKPLYRSISAHFGMDRSRGLYVKMSDRYHPITQHVVSQMLSGMAPVTPAAV